MKFGKGLQTQIEETLPEWRDKFLAYKPLKKRLKQISAPEFFTEVGFYALNLPLDGYCTSVAQKVSENLDAAGTTKQPVVEETIAGVGDDLTHRPRGVSERKHGGCGTGISEKDNFVNLLNDELEKFNDFFIDKEEEYVIRIQELKERIERVKEKSLQKGAYTSESEFSEDMIKIRKDIVTIHGEMVLLENYSSLNFAGIVKILKKYDKRTGALLRLPFTQRVLHQPFFTTELLSRLVRECEANLESVFPSGVGEVGDGLSNNGANVHEESVEGIYRSTLAAMRTIQDLRRGSSTYSPLSFPAFVQSEIGNGSGVVIDENTIPNSSNTSQSQSKESVPSTNHELLSVPCIVTNDRLLPVEQEGKALSPPMRGLSPVNE